MAESGWQAWVKKHANNIWRVAIVLLFLLLAIWALSLSHFDLVIAHSEPWRWLTNALIQVGPELAGIVIGVVTIDYLNERRQDEQLKEQLILQMGSSHNDVTDTAIRALRARGWMSDGSLQEANLITANLSGASLEGADLSGASLEGADLSGASLEGADLSRANLLWANLSKASLWGANLSGALLMESNLSGASLERADLSGASLEGADLSGAKYWTIEQLEQAKTLVGTIMPDKVRLGGEISPIITIEGPMFEEWKAQFLAKSRTERDGWQSVMPEDTEPTDGA